MTPSLHAGIYSLGRETADRREVWESLVGAAQKSAGNTYRPGNSRYPFRAYLLTEVARSSDRAILRYRTIEANVRRKPGCPTLVELSVGNSFVSAGDSGMIPLHIVDHPRYAEWARNTAAVSLTDHVHLVNRFVEHANSSGGGLQADRLLPHTLRPAEVANASGARQSLDSNLVALFGDPIRFPDPVRDYLVVTKCSQTAKNAATLLGAAFQRLLGRHYAKLPRIAAGPKVSADCTNLILLDESLNLTTRTGWLDALRTAESAGVRFKLSKVATLSNQFAVRNLAFDLFHLAGGRAWVTLEKPTHICALDAGHDAQRKVSRWVGVESDAHLEIRSVSVTPTERAEHVPARILESLWPKHREALLCRDGRMSQERAAIEKRAAREGREVIEVKKSPQAVLWRTQHGELQPAAAGDAVEDSHGDWLLQTIRTSPRDYAHPLRLTVHGADPVELATRFFHQHAMPGLSLGSSRLSGALYFADLVSKTTGDGWTRAIGRGFQVPQVVPLAPLPAGS